jgi:hypothetical protein
VTPVKADMTGSSKSADTQPVMKPCDPLAESASLRECQAITGIQ